MADGDGSGFNIELTNSDLTPPPAQNPELGDDAPESKSGSGKGINLNDKKVPLSKNVVKFPLLAGSRAVADVLEYPRFAFTEEEGEALAAAIAELGLEFTPMVNIMLLASGMLAGKTMGYVMWRRQGKPPLNPDGTKMPRQSAPSRPQGGGPYCRNGG